MGGRVLGVLLSDHEIERAVPGLAQRRLGLVLHHLDPQGRKLLPQHAQHLGHDAEHGGLEHRHPDRARDLGVAAVQGGLRALESGEQLFGLDHERSRCRGQLEPPAGLAQQGDSGLALERRELLRHGRRGVAERFGDRCDGAASLQLPEQSQSFDLEHRTPPRGMVKRT